MSAKSESDWSHKEEGRGCDEKGCFGNIFFEEIPDASGGGWQLKCDTCRSGHGPYSPALFYCSHCNYRVGVNRVYQNPLRTFRHCGCHSEVEFVGGALMVAANSSPIMSGESEEEKVQAWRLELLLRAGYPIKLAETMAQSSVDLHSAVDIVVVHGCRPEVAAEILI